MENLDTFYGHLVYFTAIGNILGPFGYILWSFGSFSPMLAFFTKKNLATLFRTEDREREYPVSSDVASSIFISSYIV
jgi:hypothetical protein